MYFAKNKNGEVMPQYTELVRATFPNVFTIAAQRTKLKFAQQYQLNITVFAGISDNARFRARGDRNISNNAFTAHDKQSSHRVG